MYELYLDDIEASQVGLKIIRRPSSPAPKMRYESYVLPGVDGTKYVYQDTYEDVVFEIEFNYLSETSEEWFECWRKAKQWLLDPKLRMLRFSDDAMYYHLIKKVDIDTSQRESMRIGKFIATFTADPYDYLIEGSYKQPYECCKYNQYDVCHPVYYISGEGMCTLAINGKKMIANVGQNIIIDSSRKISYRIDKTLCNTDVTGSYDDLFLLSGANEISISAGFKLEIMPNWRCK